MSRAQVPAAPADDLQARRSSRDRIADGSALTFDLSAFIQSGISVVVASVTGGGSPIAGRALACRIGREGVVRVLMREPGNSVLLDAISKGGAIAVTFTRPHDHRSIQIKAPAARIADTSPEDAAETARQCACFREELVFVEYTSEFASAYAGFEAGEIVAIELSPVRIFVQTPGPGAGSELAT